MEPTVYILLSERNNQYYIGATKDLARRLKEHERGGTVTTKRLAPMHLVFSQELSTLEEAKRIERWLKRQKNHKFIERIIKEGKITKSGRVV